MNQLYQRQWYGWFKAAERGKGGIYTKKYIGTKEFYKSAITLALPIMIQNAITNFVGLLDNVMIGRVGTNALSGVAIGNQLIFIFMLLLMGATAGVGIFTAQYQGTGDTVGVRYTFRVKLMVNTVASIIVIFILYLYREQLIGLFLQGEGEASDVVSIMGIGKSYLSIMLFGLLPMGISTAYSGTLRDIGKTRVPMISSFLAIGVNLVGNLLLIYGLFGLPALGADGAAIATVISRFVEMGFLAFYTGRHTEEFAFIKGAFDTLYVPGHLVLKYIVSSIPLMCNETLWSVGQTFMIQCYSYRSLDAVAAINIKNTLWNLVGVAFLTMGEAVGIIVGQILGRGDIEEAKDSGRKLLIFTVFLSVVFASVMFAVNSLFPLLYNTSDSVRELASKFIMIYSLLTPVMAFTHVAYFTMRAGGQVWITLLFDSVFMWFIAVPFAFVLSRYTGIGILTMVCMVESLEIVKSFIGGFLLKSGKWAKRVV